MSSCKDLAVKNIALIIVYKNNNKDAFCSKRLQFVIKTIFLIGKQ